MTARPRRSCRAAASGPAALRQRGHVQIPSGWRFNEQRAHGTNVSVCWSTTVSASGWRCGDCTRAASSGQAGDAVPNSH